MTIKKLSKCIYEINNQRIDTRKKTDYISKLHGVRSALYQYISSKNPRLSVTQKDRFTCKIMNGNIQTFNALENGVFVKH